VRGVQFLPHLIKPLGKATPKATREEKGRAAKGAGGDEGEFTGTVSPPIEGHGAGAYTLDGAGPELIVPSGSQITKSRVSAPAGAYLLPSNNGP